jgi:hypothetical protein
VVGCWGFEMDVEGQKSTISKTMRNMSMDISYCRSRRADYEYVYYVNAQIKHIKVLLKKPKRLL